MKMPGLFRPAFSLIYNLRENSGTKQKAPHPRGFLFGLY